MKLVTRIREAFKSPFDHQIAQQLYVVIVDQARSAPFYEAMGVPDTPEGRYDLLALHTYLTIRRLQQAGTQEDAELSQAIFDIMFADLDQNMREMSIGDTGVAKRIRKMAEGYYGRAAAYDKALALSDDDTLKDAIDRNVFRKAVSTPESLTALSMYMRKAEAHLEAQSIEDIRQGRLSFPGPVD